MEEDGFQLVKSKKSSKRSGKKVVNSIKSPIEPLSLEDKADFVR